MAEAGYRRVHHMTIGLRNSDNESVRRQDDRDRELEVIVVATGGVREAFLPVIHARPSRIAK